MKRILFTIAICCVAINVAYGQNRKGFSLTGNVIDADSKEPIEQVTIQLVSLPDSAFVTGTVTLTDGKFELKTQRPGKYALKLSYVGYLTKVEPIEFTREKSTIQLGKLSLSTDAVMLGEAVVVAEAPPVTMKEDTTIYAASAYRVAEGAMLEELVKNLPGAEVDKDGKITMNGKEIKKIMVDGKEFFSDDPKMSMKNLPASMVENVKAYEKKSDMARITGIDDGEEEAVLDLTVKKGMKQGWIGNLIAGYGNKERYEAGGMLSRFLDNSSLSVVGSANNTNNAGFSEFGDAGEGLGSGNAGSGITASKSVGINYARDTEKLQFGGNIQYGYSDNDAQRKSSKERFLGGDESDYEESLNQSIRKRHDVRADLRLEWRIDTMTTLIFRPNVSYSQTDAWSSAATQTFNNEYSLIKDRTSSSSSKSNNLSLRGNLQFFRKLNNKGRNFSIFANFGYSEGDTDRNGYTNSIISYYDENGEWTEDETITTDRQTARTSDNLNYRLSASYTEPIFKNHFLQLRYNFNHRNSLSQSLIYDNLEEREEYKGLYVDSLSNRVENQYDTHTAEVSIRGIRPKMMYNAGVAITPQSSRSETTIGPNADEPERKQNVVNFAPSVMFRYTFSKQHVLMLRYNGRSSAPNIQDLQYIIDQTDPFDIQLGNPNLKPSFENNLRVSYNNYIPATMRSYSANLFYSNTINSVANRTSYDRETTKKVSEKVNINGNWNMRGNFSFNTPFKNKKYTLSSNTSTTFSNSRSYDNNNIGKDDDTTQAELSNTRNLRLNERLRGNYRTDKFDVSLTAALNYNLTRNNKQSNGNRETFDYTFGGNTNVNLPWQLYASTDVNYRIKQGYSGEFNNNEVIWNAQLSKNFLKNNSATLRFKIYDILRQQSNLSRSISAREMTDTEYNTLGSYFMVHFVYRLNTLGGKAAKRGGAGRGGYNRGGEGGGRGGFGGPPPGRF